MKIWIATLAVLMFSAGVTSAQDVIGYVTKSTTRPDWQLINKGARDAADAAGIRMITVGASYRGDLTSQLEMFEGLVKRGVKAIAVGSVEGGGIAPAVSDAQAAGIPVIALHDEITIAKPSTFVGTDHLAASRVQGVVAATLVPEDGAIVYISGNLGDRFGRERRDGFMETFKVARPEVNITEFASDWDQNEVRQALDLFLSQRDDLDLIVTAWDGATVAAVRAALNAGYAAGDINIFGHGGSAVSVDALREGWVSAILAENLYRTGYRGIEAAIAAARGGDLPAKIDTGYFLVTPETVDVFDRLIHRDTQD